MRLSDWRNTRLRLALVYVLAICSFQAFDVRDSQKQGRSRRLADLPEIHNGLMFHTDAKVAPNAPRGGTPWTFPVGDIDSISLLSLV